MTSRTLLFVPLLAALVGCGDLQRDTAEQATASSPAVSIHTLTLAPQEWPATYETTGTVRARASTVIASKWMGYVREVRVNVGDAVRTGQLLVLLDSRDLDASASRAKSAVEQVRNAIPEANSAIAAEKANLDLVQATFKRMNELYQKQSISDQEFDQATAKLKSAEASDAMARAKRAQLDSQLGQAEQELRAAEVSRSYAQIVAPAAGIVTTKSVEPGDLATPGAPLFTVEQGGYRLEASVEESKLSAIRTGRAVSVTVDGSNRSFEARISEVVPAVDAASRSYIAKIDLASMPGLRSGMFGRAAFQLGTRTVLAIPVAAVTERGQLESVFVAESGVAHARLVTLGEKSTDEVEVLSGLNAGEQLIFPLPGNLADGARVEAKP